MQKIEVLNGEKKKEKEKIAREMLLDGQEMEKIVRYTGLYKELIMRIKNEAEERPVRY